MTLSRKKCTRFTNNPTIRINNQKDIAGRGLVNFRGFGVDKTHIRSPEFICHGAVQTEIRFAGEVLISQSTISE